MSKLLKQLAIAVMTTAIAISGTATTATTSLSPITAQAATTAKQSITLKNVNGSTKKMITGETFTLKSNYTAGKLTFKSSKPEIASVTSKGKITAKKAGTAKITVVLKANKKVKKVLTVKVLKPLEVTNISNFNKTLQVGKNFTIKTNYKASDLIFTPTDTNIISVDSNGKITALAVGETSIIIANKNNGTLSTTIKINAVKLTKIVGGKMEESFNPVDGKSNYRIYIDTTKSVVARGQRTFAAFTIKDLPSDLKTTPNGGKLWNESFGDFIAIGNVDPTAEHITTIKELSDAELDKWSVTGKSDNITRDFNDDYYKIYFTYDNISQYGQYTVLDVALQDAKTLNLTEIFFSFNKLNENKLTEEEILAIGESITLGNFTADDLGK